MKKSIILLSCCMLLLSACNQPTGNKATSAPITTKEQIKTTKQKQDTSSTIVSKEPIVIAETPIYDSTYQLQLVMTKGEYISTSLSANPNVWHGDFMLRVLDYDNVVSEEKIDFGDDLETAFPYSFQLHTKDLNQDKCIDVAIGQYVSEGKMECQLYSINKKGILSSLNIKDINTFYVAGNEISPQFTVTKDGKVKYSSFKSNKDGSSEITEKFLTWDKNTFILH